MPMKLNYWTASTLGVVAAVLLAACSEQQRKPDESVRIDGPNKEVAYLVETFRNPPLAGDDTIVYAIPAVGAVAEKDKFLVLRGEYLQIRVSWSDANNVNICLMDGLTTEYRNLSVVRLNEHAVHVRNHLLENCGHG
jgi:hypothetical protein